MDFERRGSHKARIGGRDGFELADLPRTKHTDETLVGVLVKAWRWQQWLEAGRYRSIRALADAKRRISKRIVEAQSK